MQKIIWKNEKRKISELSPAKYNPRKLTEKQAEDLSKSLERFQLADPIVINADNTIIGGHQRIKILKAKGIEEVDVRVPDRKLTEAEEKELNLRLNKNLGEWDFDLLADFGEDLLKDVGFDSTELDKIFQFELKPEDDAVPEPRKETDIKAGDIFLIGSHRLMCGDSTKREDVAKLMDGKKADMVFTDPPYGIGYEYNSHKDAKGDEYLKFCNDWFNNLISLKSEHMVITTGWGYQKFWWNKNPKDCLYWICKNKQTGGTVFHFRRVEPVFVWGKPFNKYNFDFFEELTDRLYGLREKHTCPKPVSLVQSIVEKGSDYKKIVVDIFLGSGTTLIACEKTNRICYGMEIDPIYCQVIIDRWEAFTKGKAKKICGS